jgi:hypothetical protein
MSVGRLLSIALLAAGVYGLFFALPSGERAEGRFDPERLAAAEVDVLKALRGHEEFGVYIALVPMLREQHRYSWFRAGQASYYVAHAMTQFIDMRQRYERVLPDLEEAARIERDWMDASFDPAVAARAELDWWVTRRLPNLNRPEQVAPLIAQDYAVRYHVSTGAVMDAAYRRAQALALTEQIDPNWTEITKVLVDSNTALASALTRPRSAAR